MQLGDRPEKVPEGVVAEGEPLRDVLRKKKLKYLLRFRVVMYFVKKRLEDLLGRPVDSKLSGTKCFLTHAAPASLV